MLAFAILIFLLPLKIIPEKRKINPRTIKGVINIKTKPAPQGPPALIQPKRFLHKKIAINQVNKIDSDLKYL